MSTKLKPEVKAAWLEALRSGRYQQGRTALHERQDWGDNYCCLGVLCEVAIEKGLSISSLHEGVYSGGGTLVDYEGSVTYLPGKVYEWATEEGSDPFRNDFVVPCPENAHSNNLSGNTSLSALNDNGKSFTEIADLIEEHL